MLGPKVRSVLAVAAASVVCGVAAGSALPAPPATPAEETCVNQGGRFDLFEDGGYACVGDFSEARLNAARAMCEHAYRGVFTGPTDFTHAYVCQIQAG